MAILREANGLTIGKLENHRKTGWFHGIFFDGILPNLVNRTAELMASDGKITMLIFHGKTHDFD